MRALVAAILILILAVPAAGQINQVIDDYPITVHQKYTCLSKNQRPFVGRFEFESLPVALQPVTVNFTLEVCREVRYPKGDWTIRLLREPEDVQVLGDSVFYWPAPHNIGDRFSGSVRIAPRTAGFRGFSLYQPECVDGALCVGWCFSPDGELEFLDKVENLEQVAPCNYLPWTFFNADSIVILQPPPGSGSMELFEWQMVVKPPFRIGDTSTIRYVCQTLKDMVRPIKTKIILVAMDMTLMPERLSPPIFADSVIMWETRVVPIAVRGANQIVFHVTSFDDETQRSHTTTIACSAIFNNDGSLRMVGDVAPWNLHDQYLPSEYREMEARDRQSIWIRSDEDAVKWTRFGAQEQKDTATCSKSTYFSVPPDTAKERNKDDDQ